MPVTIDRTWLNAQVDDDGTGTTGSILDKADFTTLHDNIDTALAAIGTATVAGSTTQVQFNDAGAFGGDAGLTYNKTTDVLTMTGGAYINDTSNAKMTTGLTINQGAADDEILALKSSDVGHTMTSTAEADTFGAFDKASATGGGLRIRGFDEGSGFGGLALYGAVDVLDASKGTTSWACVHLNGQKASGGAAGTPGANDNLVVVQSNGTTRFILDADGDSHQDVGTAWTNFDDRDDALTLTALSAAVSQPGDPVREAFVHLIEAHRPELEAAGFVTFNEDGHHFINWSRTHMLLIGAVRQLATRIEVLQNEVQRLRLAGRADEY